LAVEEVPEPLWSLLEDDRYVSDALDPDSPDGKDELLARAKRQLRFYRQMGSGASPESRSQDSPNKPLEVEGLESPALQERANAVVPYLLKRHALNSSVEDIRKKIGAPLSRAEARKFLQPADPDALGEPTIVWNGEEVVEVGVEKSDLLREILETAQYLYGPWLPMDMGWWILTDEPPRIQVIQAEIMGWGWSWTMTTLRVPVWASTSEVAQFYTRLRQGQGFRRLHNPAPGPSSRRLALFRFVSEHSEFDTPQLWKGVFTPRKPWRELMQLWNERLGSNHDWLYDDPRNFRRDFVHTRDALFKSHG
jgi:hypothetical protein